MTRSVQAAAPPRVSVLMLTFNQEEFIEQAVNSAVLQKTDFRFEIVIGEDCSTDATCRLLRELLSRHPDRIRVLFRDRNLGMIRNLAETLDECNGDYVAFLEGDDFWTDERKLQTQADFLDDHPGCSLCFHPVKHVDARGAPAEWPRSMQNGTLTTLDDLLRENYIPTCSLMLRRSVLPALPEWMFGLKMGDWPLCILASERGAIGRLPREMAAYRIHPNGSWSATRLKEKLLAVIQMYEKLLGHLDKRYSDTILAMLAVSELKASVECDKRDDRVAGIEHLTRSFQYRLRQRGQCVSLGQGAVSALVELLLDCGREYPASGQHAWALSATRRVAQLLDSLLRSFMYCRRGIS